MDPVHIDLEGYRVLVEPNPAPTHMGGLVIPEGYEKAVQMQDKLLRGTVRRIGTGGYSKEGEPMAVTVPVGATVYWHRKAGKRVNCGAEDAPWLILRVDDLELMEA